MASIGGQSMIQLTPQHQVFVCIEAIDFRKGIDGLVGLCRGELQQDVYSGRVFVFRNRRGTAVKVLVYDGTGFWLMQKRFSSGRLRDWPQSESQSVSALNLIALLNQGQVVEGPSWRALPSSSAAKVD